MKRVAAIGLAELRAGIGVGAHLALLDHDVALGSDNGVGQHEAAHAVGLERHHRVEVLLATRW